MIKRNIFVSGLRKVQFVLADLAIEKLFGEYVSILAFVEASLPFTKTFKGVNVQIFVLFKRLIERYKGKVTDYAGDIVKVRFYVVFGRLWPKR